MKMKMKTVLRSCQGEYDDLTGEEPVCQWQRGSAGNIQYVLPFCSQTATSTSTSTLG